MLLPGKGSGSFGRPSCHPAAGSSLCVSSKPSFLLSQPFALTVAALALLLVICSCRSELECANWQEISAAVSPDGSRRIAKIEMRGVQPGEGPALRIESLDRKGEAVALATDVSPVMRPVFTPDGKNVLFLKRGTFHMLLMSVPADGSAQPTELASLRVSPQHLTCLPANDSIVFVCFLDGWFGTSCALKTFDLKNDVMTEFEKLPTPDIETAAVSADGKTIVFTNGRAVWKLDATAGKDAVAEDVSYKISPLDKPMHFALSADGSLLCLRVGRLENRDLGNPDSKFTMTELSKIKFKTVDMRRLLLVDLNGTQEPKTVAEKESWSKPVFSPDSKRLAFIESNRLCVYDLASGSKDYVICPRYEFGGFLAWLDDASLMARVFTAPRVGASLEVFKVEPRAAQGKSASPASL